MNLINDYFNPERIISYNEATIITPKEYELLKKLSKLEREKIVKERSSDEIPNYIEQKLRKKIFFESNYKELPQQHREIILANAIFPNDTTIIDLLTKNGFTIEHIKHIIRFRSILKNHFISNYAFNEEMQEKINIYTRVVNKLINIFEKKYNYKNSTIILNKITEILILHPTLLESKSDPLRKTRKQK